jgi:hypothetical protein
MNELYAESENATSSKDSETLLRQVNRVERQGALLLGALRWIYSALSAFAAAALVTLLGAVFGHFGNVVLVQVVVSLGLLLGVVGVTGLIGGCVNLTRATQLSLANISEEAALIRARQGKRG